jgi:hypothetical protein
MKRLPMVKGQAVPLAGQTTSSERVRPISLRACELAGSQHDPSDPAPCGSAVHASAPFARGKRR